MPEDFFQEKTEEATPKRLQKAREEGNVARSTEFNSVFILLFALLTLYFLSDKVLNEMILLFKTFYHGAGHVSIHESSIQYYLNAMLKASLIFVVPLILGITAVSVGLNLVQVGFLFTLKPLMPKLDRINPISGFKKLFSLRSLVELAKGIFKILLVSLITYWTIIGQKEQYFLLVHESVGNIISFISNAVFRVALTITAALLGLAILDYIFQKWQFNKNMRMSKQEVKEEQKEVEGDPLIKSAIRSLQRAQARQRMMAEVPKADVVVTNPTELAVALKYDPEVMNAPRVVAKGARLIAKKIKEIAKNFEIPLYENKPLARSLYKIGKIGQPIPFELYHAVAEVFAYVYQLKQKS